MAQMSFNKRWTPANFKALLVAIFCGALNDNIYRLSLSLSIKDDHSLFYLAQAAFFLPFVFCSPFAGSLADRYPKSIIVKLTKAFELVVMLAASYFLLHANVGALIFILLLMGFHSTVFSPSKYGLLPEITSRQDLSRANGYVELSTFIAILLGTLIAPQLVAYGANSSLLTAAAVCGVATIGLVFGLRIGDSEGSSTRNLEFRNPIAQLYSDFRLVSRSKYLLLTFLAIVYFWFIGASFQTNVLLYADYLHLGTVYTGLFLTVFSIGVGLGSVFAGRVSEGKVELGLVPIGAAGMPVFLFILGLTTNITAIVISIFALGFSAGIFIVPLQSFFQDRAPTVLRGRFLACLNAFSFLGMLIGTLLLSVVDKLLGLNPAQVYIAFSVIALAISFYIVKTMPLMLLRCLNWFLTHTLYSVTVVGREYIPQKGGALLVCNHVTYTDPSIILASVERPVRFLIYRPIYEKWIVKKIAKHFNCIPIATEDDPKSIVQALNIAREAIQNGELVCIFAEGGLTRHGNMLSFKKGLEHIMRGISAPIIPIYLDQVWGSIFSYKNGKIIWKWPQELPHPVTLAWGKPLPPDSRAWQVRHAVQALSATLYPYRKTASRLLHTEFVRVAKKHPLKQCVCDSTGASYRYLKLLVSALCFADITKSIIRNQQMVAVLLPPSVASVLTNLTLLFLGRIPINLNYTSSKQQLEAICARCNIDTIITSRALLAKLGHSPQPNMLYIEDLRQMVPSKLKVKYTILATLLPYKSICKRLISSNKSPNDIATIIFSSGSTGQPKGVMLSHANIISNVESLYEIVQLGSKDSLLGILPFFHAFGFTAALWLPILSGIRAAYHYNPMEAEIIGKLCERNHVSIMLATPTFLLNFIRRCSPEQFRWLHYAIVGAEKLRDNVAYAFHSKFNVMPLEGYGCTELAPVTMINIPDFKDVLNYQVGHKLGTVGHPLPGIAVRIVDVESGKILPPKQEGMLQVKGPNVMLGYFGDETSTNEAIVDGWYSTGDIAILDEDGFVKITDRLSRFSKIAGEMVPHVRIEDEIHKVLGSEERACVVCAIPDERKGEKLVVLHTTTFDYSDMTKKLSLSGLPNLWIPKKENFFLVSSFPVLGSGKLDLRGVKELAMQLAINKA